MSTVYQSPEIQKEETLLSLSFEHPVWSGLRKRVERTAGLDAELRTQFNYSAERIDYLLDTLFMQIAVVVPIWDFDPVAGLSVVDYDQRKL